VVQITNSLFDRVESLLERLVDSSSSYISVSLKVDAGIADSFLRIDSNDEKYFWVPQDSRGWRAQGVGIGVRVDGFGEFRFEQIKKEAQKFFETVSSESDDSLHLLTNPDLRFYGGVSFLPGSKTTLVDNIWKDFNDGTFIIPRWQYATNDEYGVLTFVTKRELIDFKQIKVEVDKIEKWILAYGQLNSDLDESSPARIVNDSTVKDEWNSLVSGALCAIKNDELKKVVISRATEVLSDRKLDVPIISCSGDAQCTRFAFYKKSACFTGVTPEQLVTVEECGNLVKADALAGSVPRKEIGEDVETINELLSSDKNRREFEYVLSDLNRRLTDADDQQYPAHVPFFLVFQLIVDEDDEYSPTT